MKQPGGAAVSLTCANASCARPLHGRVGYCPFCGTAASQSSLRPPRPVEVEEPVLAIDPVPATPLEIETPAPEEPPPVKPAVARKKAGRNEVIDVKPVVIPELVEVDVDPPKKKKRWGRWLLGVFFAFVAWRLLVPSGPDSCADALMAAGQAEQRGEIEAVKAHAVEAISVCRGDQHTKARQFFEGAEKRIASDQGCLAATQEYKALLGQGRLQQAVALASQKLRNCTAGGAAQARERELQEIRQTISVKQDAVRMRLEAGDIAGARSVVEDLKGLDRDNPRLSELNATIDRVEKEAAARREAEAAAASPPPQVPSAPAPQPPQQPAPQAAPGQSGQDMAAVMLREGEAALAQKRYAEARALAASILRAMPSSAHARDLMNRANEAESRALREETTLK